MRPTIDEWHYYKNLLTVALKRTVHRFFASPSDQFVIFILGAILTALLLGIDPPLNLSKDHWNFLTPTIAVAMVFIATFLMDFLRTPYLLSAEPAKEIAEIKDELNKKLSPRFEIISGQGPPISERYNETYQGKLFRRLVRIGLHNPTLTTIEDASVSIIRVEPSTPIIAATVPVVLHQMHDNTFQKREDVKASARGKVLLNNITPYQLKFDLHPADTTYIDVVSRLEYKEGVANRRMRSII